MSILVLLQISAQPDKVAALKAAFGGLLPDTRAYDGCEGITVHTDQDDPTRIVLLERWASRGHYERYFAWRVERGDLDALGALTAGPPSISYLDDTDH